MMVRSIGNVNRQDYADVSLLIINAQMAVTTPAGTTETFRRGIIFCKHPMPEDIGMLAILPNSSQRGRIATTPFRTSGCRTSCPENFTPQHAFGSLNFVAIASTRQQIWIVHTKAARQRLKDSDNNS